MKLTLNTSQKKTLARIIAAAALLIIASLLPLNGVLWTFAFLVPYLVIGFDVLFRAARNIVHGRIFDENFLMAIATIGALAIQSYPEAVFVMLFYQTGELFQDVAVARSRKSIADLMNLAPETATVIRDGVEMVVRPENVGVNEMILIKVGSRVPLDGVVVNGASTLDTSALTGESLPRAVDVGDKIVSGCINLSGVLVAKTTKTFGDSAVSRILELVENASSKKSKAENFISIFARYYTPVVVVSALVAAFVPPIFFGGSFSEWVFRALIFLVVSCPCALVISVPLGFFGGIGAASRHGILVKGGNYLEALAKADTFVFDKTGTITNGTFEIESGDDLALFYAAHAGHMSTHPLSVSICKAMGHVDKTVVKNISEVSGRGISAEVLGHAVLSGSARFLHDSGVKKNGTIFDPPKAAGTVVFVSVDGEYVGCITLKDSIKPEAKEAFDWIRRLGVKKTVLLTGDRKGAAENVSSVLGIDVVHSDLLPQDKVSVVEELLLVGDGHLVFVGDGINDAPVLARADIGVAMGALGSDAAIEAADVVLMDDSLVNIPKAIGIARKTRRIVIQNIIFALGVKVCVILLAVLGIANMWEAVFADVGVAVIAILNSMRMLRV